MAQTAPQNGKKLSARELFYAETAPPAPAKPAAAAKPAHRPVPAKPAATEQAAQPSPPPAAPAKLNGNFSGTPARTAIVPVAYSPEKPLGLRYSFLRNAGGDEYREVDPDTVFRSGDRIRVAAQSNDEGYLYIVMKGASGSWKVLFPSAEIADGSNRVASGRQYLIPPPPGRFAFDEQAGEERLFIVLSRHPEPSLEQLIYSLGSASPGPKRHPAEANEPPKHLLTASIGPGGRRAGGPPAQPGIRARPGLRESGRFHTGRQEGESCLRGQSHGQPRVAAGGRCDAEASVGDELSAISDRAPGLAAPRWFS